MFAVQITQEVVALAKRKRIDSLNEMRNACAGVLDEAVRNAQNWFRKYALLICVKACQFVETWKGTTNRHPLVAGCVANIRYFPNPYCGTFHTFLSENQANSKNNYVKGTSQTPGVSLSCVHPNIIFSLGSQ